MSSFYAPIKKVEPPPRPKRGGVRPGASEKIKARWREGAYDKVKSPTGLSKFCTKIEHAKLRFDGVKKCPQCRHSTTEIYHCPSVEQAIQRHRDKRALINAGKPIPRRRSSSDYAGINFTNLRREWHTRIRVNGERKHLGYFKTLRDALNAYNRAAKEHGLPSATARPRFIFKDAQEIRDRRAKYWREVAGPRRRAARLS